MIASDGRISLVSTPIGRANDITLHALEVFRRADILLAEDTRVLRKLLDIHNVSLGDRPVYAYHDHNANQQHDMVQQALKDGKWLAFSSDAGTPLMSDPGYQLVQIARELGAKVDTAPGASAIHAALCVAGQPIDRYFFGGFLPPKSKARMDEFYKFQTLEMTGVYFESPNRLKASLSDLKAVCGEGQKLSVCRELTKKFEEVIAGTVFEVLQEIESRERIKGEVVLVLAPAKKDAASIEDVKQELAILLKTEKVKSAAALIAAKYDLTRNEAYGLALEQKKAIDG